MKQLTVTTFKGVPIQCNRTTRRNLARMLKHGRNNIEFYKEGERCIARLQEVEDVLDNKTAKMA